MTTHGHEGLIVRKQTAKRLKKYAYQTNHLLKQGRSDLFAHQASDFVYDGFRIIMTFMM